MRNLVLDFRHGYVLGERLFSEEPAYQFDEERIISVYVPEQETTFSVQVGRDNEPYLASLSNIAVEAAEDGGYHITAVIPTRYFKDYGLLHVYVVGIDNGVVATVYDGAVDVKNRPNSEDAIIDDEIRDDPETVYEIIERKVAEQLEAHPEWTTTVEDGAVTTAKLATGAVTREKIANSVFAGIADDVIEQLDIVSASGDGIMSSAMYTDVVAPLGTAITQSEIDALFS